MGNAGGNTIPNRAQLLFYAKAPGMVDSIGLSISELYPLVDPALRSILSADGGVTRRLDADIVTLALASPLLNTGKMIGSVANGVAIYATGTSDAVLKKACKVLHSVYYPPGLLSVVSRAQPTKVKIVIEGDSRSAAPSPADPIWWVNYINTWPMAAGATVANYAQGGDAMASMITQYLSQTAYQKPISGELAYWILIAAANDLGTGMNATGTDTYVLVKQLWALARADGFVVVAATEAGSSSWGAGNLAQRDIYNALVRGDASLYDYLLEPDVAVPVTNAALYVDGTHPNDAGAHAYANMVAAKMPASAPNIPSNQTINLSAGNYRLTCTGPGAVVSAEIKSATNLAPGGGTFNTNLTGWSNGGSFWTWGSQQAVFNNAIGSSLVAVNAVAGKKYRVTYEITSISAGSFKITIGGVISGLHTALGIYSFVATAGNIVWGVTAAAGTNGAIDNVVCQEVLSSYVSTETTPASFTAVAGNFTAIPNPKVSAWQLIAV